MKHLKKFNESKIYDYSILPKNALEELEMYVNYKDPKNKIEVILIHK